MEGASTKSWEKAIKSSIYKLDDKRLGIEIKQSDILWLCDLKTQKSDWEDNIKSIQKKMKRAMLYMRQLHQMLTFFDKKSNADLSHIQTQGHMVYAREHIINSGRPYYDEL